MHIIYHNNTLSIATAHIVCVKYIYIIQLHAIHAGGPAWKEQHSPRYGGSVLALIANVEKHQKALTQVTNNTPHSPRLILSSSQVPHSVRKKRGNIRTQEIK